MLDDTLQDNYLTVSEAATYVGVSAQTLRRWDESGVLKSVRHPANGYRFYRRDDLEPFRLEYGRAATKRDTVGLLFQASQAHIVGNSYLREPQIEAYEAVSRHFRISHDPAVVQVPVGCGKTGVIAILPFNISSGRVLVVTPNLTIRKGVSESLDISRTKCFWTRTRVLKDYTAGPYVAVLDGLDANLHDCSESHFVVTNIQQLVSSADRWLPQFPAGFFDMIIIDEGHHNAAESWRKLIEKFPNAKIVSLTATPFRSDQKALEGEIIYQYPLTRAMLRGYIKELHSSNVAPSRIYFTYRGDPREHTLDEVLQLREEQWFRRGVALAPECNRHIAEASIQRWKSLRERTGYPHQIIAAACSVDHARQVRSIYEELGISCSEIHSNMDLATQERVITDLRYGRLDCIVQVQMLGEGFDHPQLSVAAIYRPFRTLAPYIQFIGRVMRSVREAEPGNPDNHAFIVSHVGLNNDARWNEFRSLDSSDQQLLHDLVTAEELEPDTRESQGGPRRFDLGMRVNDEIISHFVDQPFFDPEDDELLDRLLNERVAGTGLSLADLGVTRDVLRAKLAANQAEFSQQPQSLPVLPQKHRQVVRRRLFERTNSVVSRVLKELQLSFPGREVSRVVPEVRNRPNRVAVVELMNRSINDYLGIAANQRDTLSSDEIERAYENLDRLGDLVRDRIREAMELG